MSCWAMRTSRDTPEIREFLWNELQQGRLRQGWGYCPDQNLDIVNPLWAAGGELTPVQRETRQHCRMGPGDGDDYMQPRDLVVVPNMPEDGQFTICEIDGDYLFEIPQEPNDLGHIRPVTHLGPGNQPLVVANTHRLVSAPLQSSFRCRCRLWNISLHQECLDRIIVFGQDPHNNLRMGSVPEERVEGIVAGMIPNLRDNLADSLRDTLPQHLQAAQWEPVLRTALESLFRVTIHHTGGPNEHGADLEIVITNPFDERDWIVPVQIKDHQGDIADGVADNIVAQLEDAFETRNGQNQVIAVVLLVSQANRSDYLAAQLEELTEMHHVPFIYGGQELFFQLLARGFLKRS